MPGSPRLLLALHLQGAHKHGQAVSERLGKPQAHIGVEGKVLGQLLGHFHREADVRHNGGTLHGVGLRLIHADLINATSLQHTVWDGEAAVLGVVQLGGGEVHHELPVAPLGSSIGKLRGGIALRTKHFRQMHPHENKSIPTQNAGCPLKLWPQLPIIAVTAAAALENRAKIAWRGG